MDNNLTIEAVKVFQFVFSFLALIAALLPLMTFGASEREVYACSASMCFQIIKALTIIYGPYNVLGFNGEIVDAAYLFVLCVLAIIFIGIHLGTLAGLTWWLEYGRNRGLSDFALLMTGMTGWITITELALVMAYASGKFDI